MPFLHANMAIEEFGGRADCTHSNLYGVWSSDPQRNTAFWRRIWAKPHHCVCMNDDLDGSSQSAREVERLTALFEHKFPRPSFIEKGRTTD